MRIKMKFSKGLKAMKEFGESLKEKSKDRMDKTFRESASMIEYPWDNLSEENWRLFMDEVNDRWDKEQHKDKGKLKTHKEIMWEVWEAGEWER